MEIDDRSNHWNFMFLGRVSDATVNKNDVHTDIEIRW